MRIRRINAQKEALPLIEIITTCYSFFLAFRFFLC